MKFLSGLIIALTLLLCLSGCDDAETNPDTTEQPTKAVEPKLSARTAQPAPVNHDAQDAAEDLDATGKDPQPVPDRDSEQYDNDAGIPNPEAGDAVREDPAK